MDFSKIQELGVTFSLAALFIYIIHDAYRFMKDRLIAHLDQQAQESKIISDSLISIKDSLNGLDDKIKQIGCNFKSD